MQKSVFRQTVVRRCRSGDDDGVDLRVVENLLARPRDSDTRILFPDRLASLLGNLVMIVYPCEPFDLTPPRPRVHSLGISLLAYLERRVHMDLDEALLADHVPDIVPACPVGTDRGRDHNASVADDLRGNESNPP